jgi:REP element-mobilizing transposase RayT
MVAGAAPWYIANRRFGLEWAIGRSKMGHTYSNALIHFVFSTKNRAPLIAESLQSRLLDYMGGIARQELGQSLRIGGTANHIHALLALAADVSQSDAMRKLKGLSSKWVHETFPEHRDFGWQTGYGAFSVSHSKAADVIQYINGQAERHKVVSFEVEFIAFLKRHKIDYDPKYVWD